MLEAMDPTCRLRWGTRLSVDDRIELDRLAEDGHQLIRDRRGTTIKVNANSARNRILYRTLIHEVGHWVDWKERVLLAKAGSHDPERKQLKNAFFARPYREIEQFANRYAEHHAARLRASDVIPFATLGW